MQHFSTPVTWTSPVRQLSVAVNGRMSFKEFGDLLIPLYGDNIVSDEEILLLYDTFKTKNPEFPHGNYKQFDLDSMNSLECKSSVSGREARPPLPGCSTLTTTDVEM